MQDDLFMPGQNKLRDMYAGLRATVMVVNLYNSQRLNARPFKSMIVRLSNSIGGDHQSRAAAIARQYHFGKEKIVSTAARYVDPVSDLGCTMKGEQ